MTRFEHDRIRALREQLGLNWEQFGRKINQPGHQIKRYESGDGLPGTRTVEAMCNAFDVPASYFFVRKIACEQTSEAA